MSRKDEREIKVRSLEERLLSRNRRYILGSNSACASKTDECSDHACDLANTTRCKEGAADRRATSKKSGERDEEPTEQQPGSYVERNGQAVQSRILTGCHQFHIL